MSQLSPMDLLKAFKQKLWECVESKKVLRKGWVKLVEAISVYFDRELKGPPTIADAIGPVLKSLQALLDKGEDAYDLQVLREALAKWDGVQPMEGIVENSPQTRNRPPGICPTSEHKPTAPLPKQPPASDPLLQEKKGGKPSGILQPSKPTVGSSTKGGNPSKPKTSNTAAVAPFPKRKLKQPSPVARMTAYSAVKAAAKAKATTAVEGDDTDEEERQAMARMNVKKEQVEAKIPPVPEQSEEPEPTSKGRKKKARFFKSKAYIDSEDDSSEGEGASKQEKKQVPEVIRKPRTMVVEMKRRVLRTSEDMDLDW